MPVASGVERSHVCVSQPVSVVRPFQAQFQTTFSQRAAWMSGSMVSFVPPVLKRLAKVCRRESSSSGVIVLLG